MEFYPLLSIMFDSLTTELFLNISIAIDIFSLSSPFCLFSTDNLMHFIGVYSCTLLSFINLMMNLINHLEI
jgi:hypothetical protein